MESQSAPSVDGKVARLPDELIQRKDKAEEQHTNQLVSNHPALESENEHIPLEPERIRTTADIDLKDESDVPVIDQAESKKPCSSSPSENATAVLRQDRHGGIETSSTMLPIHMPDTRTESQQAVNHLQSPQRERKESRAIDTYSFMEHFPHGIWWTRLDGDQGLSRSLDFGANGFTASLNTGHEILQMTAPDHRYGLVYARGSFADNPDAILARAQRTSGGKSTFGLKWLESIGNYRRGRIEYHGLLNFRWPYKRYALDCPGSLSGTLGSLSFVKDEMVYQILRFQPGTESHQKSAAHVAPSLPPTVPKPQSPTTSTSPTKPEYHDVKVTIGGVIKFGGTPHYLEDAPYVLEWEDKSISCHMSNEIPRLNFELFLNGEKEKLSIGAPSSFHDSEINMTVEKRVRLVPGEPFVIVGRTSLRSDFETPLNGLDLPLPSSTQLVEYLGASIESENATDRVWNSRIDLNADIDGVDFCTSAACLEQILGVTSVPMRRYWEISPTRPGSSDSSGKTVSLVDDFNTHRAPDTTSLPEDTSLPEGTRLPEDANPPGWSIIKSSESSKNQDSVTKVASISEEREQGIVDSTPSTDAVDHDWQKPPTSNETNSSAALIVSEDTKAAIASLRHAFSAPANDAPDEKTTADTMPLNVRQSHHSHEAPLDERWREHRDFAAAYMLAARRRAAGLSADPGARTIETVDDAENPDTGDVQDGPEMREPGRISVYSPPAYFPCSTSRSNFDRGPNAVTGQEYQDLPMDFLKSHPATPPLMMDDNNMGIALYSDLLCNQWVDVQRSFWQIRYLVKAYNFLAPQTSKSEGRLAMNRSVSNFEETSNFKKVRESYLRRIAFHIRHSLVWIARARLPSGYHVKACVPPFSESRAVLDIEDVDDDRALYPPIIIWYVIENCPEALPEEFMPILAECIQQLVCQEYEDLDITSNHHKPKLTILLWYRHYCLARLSKRLSHWSDVHKVSSDPAPKGPWNLPSEEEIKGFENKARAWQEKAEKAMRSSRKAAVDSYSGQDESADRLAYLGIELGLVMDQELKRPSSCLSQARRKILDRKPTIALNPGAPLFDQDGSVRVSTSAPWELTCVNHHIRLLLLRDPDLEDGIYSARKDCLRFESTNFIFTGSWDISKSTVMASFWDLDASCMICATFLDMRIKNETLESTQDSAAAEALGLGQPHISRRRTSIAAENSLPNNVRTGDAAKGKGEPQAKRDAGDENVVELLRRYLEKQEAPIHSLKDQSQNAIAFDWTVCEPPVPVHPDTWVQSLDDTPELFRATETRVVHLRKDLETYLNGEGAHTQEGCVLDAVDWTADNLSGKFAAGELLFLTVYDLGVLEDDYCEREVVGRLQPSRNVVLDLRPGFHRYLPNYAYFYYGKWEITLGLWTVFLDGSLDTEIEQLPHLLRQRYDEIDRHHRDQLLSQDVVLEAQSEVQRSLLTRLSDSLVDCNTRNRIFFIQRCSRSIVKAFIYLWHRESIDTFDDHFRNTSNFSDSQSDTWITSITISFWGFTIKRGVNDKIFHEPRDTAPFPPKLVSRGHRPKAMKRKRDFKMKELKASSMKHIVEGSSSLVISGDNVGRWWTCSVISSIIPEATMRQTMRDSKSTLTEFIHQPSTGRCLVFLAFLGVLCERLALEYEAVLDELTTAINLGREVLKHGLDWTHTEDAIQRLKSMLWALEALRIFDDRLVESLDKVKEAGYKMQKYISHDPGIRHGQLERQCQILLETFDKNHGRLTSVHIKIEQKITQISRYREGISAVSNLEDTHTALKQNDTIRILTYITIAYLPLSFIATVFSMSIVTESHWGPNLFGGLIIIFFISTLVLARSLDFIFEKWARLVKITRKRVGLPPKHSDIDDLLDEAEDEMESQKTDYDTGSDEEEGSSTSIRRKWPMAFMKSLRARKNSRRKNSVDKNLP